MENEALKPSPLTLLLCVPGGVQKRIDCDSVRFSVPDGRNGQNGGSVGIRKGHTDALMALEAGGVRAFLAGEEIFSCRVGTGLAMIHADIVRILTDSAEYEGDGG